MNLNQPFVFIKYLDRFDPLYETIIFNFYFYILKYMILYIVTGC